LACWFCLGCLRIAVQLASELLALCLLLDRAGPTGVLAQLHGEMQPDSSCIKLAADRFASATEMAELGVIFSVKSLSP
jgi:hypothetical protein